MKLLFKCDFHLQMDQSLKRWHLLQHKSAHRIGSCDPLETLTLEQQHLYLSKLVCHIGEINHIHSCAYRKHAHVNCQVTAAGVWVS